MGEPTPQVPVDVWSVARDASISLSRASAGEGFCSTLHHDYLLNDQDHLLPLAEDLACLDNDSAAWPFPRNQLLHGGHDLMNRVAGENGKIRPQSFIAKGHRARKMNEQELRRGAGDSLVLVARFRRRRCESEVLLLRVRFCGPGDALPRRPRTPSRQVEGIDSLQGSLCAGKCPHQKAGSALSILRTNMNLAVVSEADT